MDHITLNNGVRMPLLGFGTYQMEPHVAQAAVWSALTSGFRHIDTANSYLNERGVGRGIAAAGLPRDEVFVSTKLWPSLYADAEAAIDATLGRLRLDYVDMLELHQPVGPVEHAWRAMEAAYRAGRARALGLSNFSAEQIERVLSFAEIRPQLVTTELHPYNQEPALRQRLEAEGIALEAWFPLGHGNPGLLGDEVVLRLARKYEKTPAQVILRWHTLRGVSVIPSSRKPWHIAENLAVFDFALSDGEMAEMAALDCDRRFFERTDEMLAGYEHQVLQFEEERAEPSTDEIAARFRSGERGNRRLT